MPRLLLLVCFIANCAFSFLYAQIKLPAFFSNNMVLQQKAAVKFWGNAAVGERISIITSWNKKKYKVLPDATGHWLTEINTPPAGGPFQIKIAGKNKIVLDNVMIGEVWLCSGQSNMDMPVKGYWNAPVLNSNDLLVNAPNHNIRLFHVAKKTASSPQTNVEGIWEEADVASVKEFSAVGYQFSLMLQKHLNLPIGIIQSTWGGSPIEAWVDSSTLSQVSQTAKLTGGATSKAPHQTPSNLFNGMIAPLIGYRMAGVLWYQGEQNRYNSNDYYLLQPAMVNAWRQKWGIGDWPFFYVQIAPMRYPTTQKNWIPYFREVQQKMVEKIPNSGMAISMDAGDENNIHPANKEIISKRLGYLALSKTYSKIGISCVGPQYKSFKVLNDTLSVFFTNAPLGMTTFGNNLTQFEVAGKDKVFYKASAVLKDAVVLVHSDAVKEPFAVRYAYTDWTIGELYGTNGLPVPAFRSDDW